MSQCHGAASKVVVLKDRDPSFLKLIVGSAVMLTASKICQDDPGPCRLSAEKYMWQLKVGE